MRILVTGGAGFIGSHVTGELLKRGHDLMILDDLSTGSASNLKRGVRLVERDIRMPLAATFDSFRPTVVIHMAAQASVSASMADPAEDLSVNVGGLLNVVRTAAKAGTRKVLFFSSAAVYGASADRPLTEHSNTAPLSPYGISKLAGELYAKTLCDTYGIQYTILRPANVFGPRQRTSGEGAVVPAFLSRFLQGIDPVIHGDGSQVRDFIYVKDLARAVVSCLENGDGLTLNVSSGVGLEIMELWLMIASVLGWERPPVYGPERLGDIRYSVMDNSLAIRHLDWKPEVSLVEGLKETIEWASVDEMEYPNGRGLVSRRA